MELTKWQKEVIDEYDAVQNYRDIADKKWIPRYHWQLVNWLSNRYNRVKSHFRKKHQDQLYAIYFKTRVRDDKIVVF